MHQAVLLRAVWEYIVQNAICIHWQRKSEGSASGAGELFKEVRKGFEDSRKFQDAYAMKYSLSNGRVQLKQLRDMLGMRL